MSNQERNFHILLVDDEEDICQIYTAYLRRHGFKVSTAYRSDEAMRILVSEDVDFIISDIKMPGASGFDLLDLSKIYQSTVPVVLISGDTDGQVIEEFGRQSVHCFQKPVKFDELLQLIEEQLLLNASKSRVTA